MTDKDTQLAAIAALMAASGLTIDDLAEHATASPRRDTKAPITYAELIRDFRATLSENTERGWRTHLNRLSNGTPAHCDCLCEACLDLVGGCRCDCTSCTRTKQRIEPAGTRLVRDGELPTSELKRNVVVTMRIAQKHARADNVRRDVKGLSPKPEHGQRAAEHAITAYRSLLRCAVDDDRLSKNPAMAVAKPRRQESKRRALTDGELTEFFDAVVTGGDDPELDFYLSWFHLETGARREASSNLRIADLQFASQTIQVYEKFGIYRDQPTSVELLEGLLGFARRRSSQLDGLSPVFYFNRMRKAGDPRTSRAGQPAGGAWPMTDRRYDTLAMRIQKTLSWANEMSFSMHCLRHTGGTIVERIAGSQVARKFLGHGSRNPTDGYTKAGLAEVAKAISQWTGASHPLAPGVDASEADDDQA